MRFKGYVINEGRSKLVYEDDAIDDIRSKCQKSVQAKILGSPLYRGVYDAPKFAFIEPKKHKRASRNTDNTYTLIIDNHPEWKKYPKRSESIICSSSPTGSSPYGNIYCVFPVDGANYGICPTNDIWSSFSRLGITDLNDWNYALRKFIPEKIIKKYVDKPDLGSIYGIKKYFKILDDMIAEKGIDFSHNKSSLPWLKGYKGDMWELVNKLLVPNKNGFKQVNNPHKLPMEGYIKEVWTDSPSYLVSEMWVRQLENRDKLVKE